MKQCAQIDAETRLDNREVAYDAGAPSVQTHEPAIPDRLRFRPSDGWASGFPTVVGTKQAAIILGRRKSRAEVGKREDQRAWDRSTTRVAIEARRRDRSEGRCRNSRPKRGRLHLTTDGAR